MKAHGLEIGDFVMLYQDYENGNYVSAVLYISSFSM